MNILILNGSPHPNGTSRLLIDAFTRGAREAGHAVTEFSCNNKKIHPCIACYHCGRGVNPCVFQDDMNEVNALLDQADVVILSTPLYYFGMSTQLKVVIDRFFGKNEHWRSSNKKIGMLMTCGDVGSWATDPLLSHLEVLSLYLGWENIGHLFAEGCYQRDQIEASDYPNQAIEWGRRL